MMARVRGVMAAWMRVTSMLYVPGSTSTSTGVPPVSTMVLRVAAKVMGVVMTSSPGCSLRAASTRCRPAVADDRASI